MAMYKIDRIIFFEQRKDRAGSRERWRANPIVHVRFCFDGWKSRKRYSWWIDSYY